MLRAGPPDPKDLSIIYDDTEWCMGNILGKGGFSTVYEAVATNRSYSLACKVAYQQTDADKFEAFYLTEVQCAGLRHPHIIHVYAYMYVPRQRAYMLLMELCSYGDLAKLLAEGWPKISLGHARCMMRQISSAIEYLHSLGVAHRDLKLENILLADFSGPAHHHFSVRVTDFGLSSVG